MYHFWMDWRKKILADKTLSFGAKAMALYLNTYMNDSLESAYPSVATICRDLNLSDKTATKYTEELASTGWVEKQRRPNKSIRYIAIDRSDNCIPFPQKWG